MDRMDLALGRVPLRLGTPVSINRVISIAWSRARAILRISISYITRIGFSDLAGALNAAKHRSARNGDLFTLRLEAVSEFV